MSGFLNLKSNRELLPHYFFDKYKELTTQQSQINQKRLKMMKFQEIGNLLFLISPE